jgi:drug/metabolite transporter (DMT)-like permease
VNAARNPLVERRFAPEGALVLAALFFGSTFVLVRDAVRDVTPMAYLLLRFGIAALALAPFAARAARRGAIDRRLLARVGALAGVLLFGGYALQTVGLQYTSATTAAFITGLYVVFTPMVEAVVRRRLPPRAVLLGIVVATIGLYLLTGASIELGKGEALELGCAAVFAVWIVYQGAYVNRLGAIPLTGVQLVVVTAIAMPATGATGGLGTLTALALFAAAFTGIMCSSVGLSLQLFAQRRLSPSRTALILLFEPVFGGLFGYFAGERLDALQLLGAMVIVAGIAISELTPRRPLEADHAGEIGPGLATPSS